MSDFDYTIIDDSIPAEFREQVWNYMLDLTWYGTTRVDNKIHRFIPSKHGLKFPESMPNAQAEGTMLSRTVFGKDEIELKEKHPIIYELWEKINNQLGNQYELTGPGEEVGIKPLVNHQSNVPGLGPGWRCYTNGLSSERIKFSHGIHRDTVDVHDSTTQTILYVANLNWLPTWMGEVVFYGEDPNGVTGDTQQTQFAVGGHTQRRGFNVGWPRAIVPAVPGRIVSYDGRMLHTTKPTSIWAPDMRITIAFRARIKPAF
jgi:hypothetical protein